jgi:hypothetical protein
MTVDGTDSGRARPALHGLIEQAPRQWKTDEQRDEWLHAFRLVLDYTTWRGYRASTRTPFVGLSTVAHKSTPTHGATTIAAPSEVDAPITPQVRTWRRDDLPDMRR